MPAGYSGTPLIRKLGIKAGMRARIIAAPDHYMDLLSPFPAEVKVVGQTRGLFNFIHLFCTTQAELKKKMPGLKANLVKDGALWISWPKKTSPLAKDLTGDGVREIGLSTGLVDVKVCAVDVDWSGLKFMWRKKDR